MNISDIFGTIGDAVTNFMSTVADGVGDVLNLFWNVGETNPGPTPLGILVLTGLGVGLSWTVFRLIRGAIRGVTKTN